MRTREARKIVADYQRKLRLQDWTIKTEVVSGLKDPGGCPCWGLSDWVAEEHSATVKLDRKQTDEQMRETVKHEMLHIRFEGNRRKPFTYDTGYEFGLNVVAELI